MEHKDSKNATTSPKDTQQRVISTRAERKGRKEVEKKIQKLEKLEVVYMPTDQVFPNAYNPNRQSEHEFELLLRSMEEDGFTQPILAQEDTKIIVDGEHRWRAAVALGFQEIPVVLTKFTPEQMRVSTFRHNRARGSEDVELAAQVLRDLRELGALEHAQDSLMLDDLEVQRLIEDMTPVEELGTEEEFNEAWVPDSFTPEEKEVLIGGGQGTSVQTRTDNTGATVDSAMTQEAVARQRKREELIARAKTEQDKEQAKQETKLYRVSLVFAGEESDIVKAALGDKPAEMLLAMCKTKIGYTETSTSPEDTESSAGADGVVVEG